MGESSIDIARASNRATPKYRSRKLRLRRQRKFFRIVAKHAYPKKTVPQVRNLTGYAESSIYEWLAGRGDAPASVLMALLGEIASDPD